MSVVVHLCYAAPVLIVARVPTTKIFSFLVFYYVQPVDPVVPEILLDCTLLLRCTSTLRTQSIEPLSKTNKTAKLLKEYINVHEMRKPVKYSFVP